MNKRRLAAIARWLEAGAPEKKGVTAFDMSMGIVFTDCGTTCCIAGAALSFFGDLEEVRIEYHFGGHRELNWGDISTQACDILGLPEVDFRSPDSVSHELFYTNGSFMRPQVTPAWAARVIRKLIKTGVVDWAGCRNE
jgi:hypothetical protein